MAEADVLNAIAALDAKLGTIVNTGGTASVGAILGDFANTNLNTRVADLHTDVAAVKSDTAAILTDTGTTLEARQIVIERLLRNRFDTDPATGIATIYADDGTTPLYTANVYEDVAGTMPFDGSGANRRDRLA